MLIPDPFGYFRFTNPALIWSTLMIILPALLWNFLDDTDQIFNVSDEKELINRCVEFVTPGKWSVVFKMIMFHFLELTVVVILAGIWKIFEFNTRQSLYEVVEAASILPVGTQEHPMFPIVINCTIRSSGINEGTRDQFPTMCHLPVNLINQATFKIFVFWCVFILVPGWLVTVCYRVLTICCPHLRHVALVQTVTVSDDCKKKLKKLVKVMPSYCSHLKLRGVAAMVTVTQFEIIVVRLCENAGFNK